MLVDAGSLSGQSADTIRDYLLEQIDRYGRDIDVLVITHPDQDHYNLLPEVLRGVPIERIFRVGTRYDYSMKFWNWLEGFPEHQVTVLQARDFDRKGQPNPVMDCGPAEVYILAAAVTAKKSRKNAMSIVLMIRYGDFEAILTGDATRDTERVIMDRYPSQWLDVEALKIGHHGSLATSTGTQWAGVVKPEIAVVSAGSQNRFGHPRKEVIERLEPYTKAGDSHGMRYATGKKGKYRWSSLDDYREAIFSTAVSANVVIRTDGRTYEVRTNPHEE